MVEDFVHNLRLHAPASEPVSLAAGNIFVSVTGVCSFSSNKGLLVTCISEYR